MSIYKYLVLFIIGIVLTFVRAQNGDTLSNQLYSQGSRIVRPNLRDLYLTEDKAPAFQQIFTRGYPQGPLQQFSPQDQVKIQFFYEVLCDGCKYFANAQFAPTVKKLSRHLDIHLYPYGNARTIIHANGSIDFECQHGPIECYGNMEQACAIDLISNITEAVEFTSCMMSSDQRSDDTAATMCGKRMNIDYKPIISCANSKRAATLLKYYGDESKKVGFRYVPYILINGVESDGDNFMRDVCAAFKNPPPECKN